MAVMYTANHLKVKAIVALTESGSTPLWMSRIRSDIPIYAFTRHEETRRRVMLYRGVYPVTFDITHTNAQLLYADIFKLMLETQDGRAGDRIILTQGRAVGRVGQDQRDEDPRSAGLTAAATHALPAAESPADHDASVACVRSRCLVLAVRCAVYLTLRASLPQLDGEIAAPKLQARRRSSATRRARRRSARSRARSRVRDRLRARPGSILPDGSDAARRGRRACGVARRRCSRRTRSYRIHAFRRIAAQIVQRQRGSDRALLDAYAAGVNFALAQRRREAVGVSRCCARSPRPGASRIRCWSRSRCISI